ncbi:hypothetical protein SLS55_005138 [Diplodia seriata]|uniref:histidine kinase n=1 Tax=Diplodia seriata TaxID=420778 RepID=A0ABR3CFI4_9PEZI
MRPSRCGDEACDGLSLLTSFLDNDDRPTFILDAHDDSSSILSYQNDALRGYLSRLSAADTTQNIDDRFHNWASSFDANAEPAERTGVASNISFGQKHPRALGRGPAYVFSELWKPLKSIINRAMQQGKATRVQDLHLSINRDKDCGLEETYYSDGTAIGALDEFVETTNQVIGDRRMNTLITLGEKASSAKDIDELWSLITTSLEPNSHDVTYALLYSVRADDQKTDQESEDLDDSKCKSCYLEGTVGVSDDHPAAIPYFRLTEGDESFSIPFRRAELERRRQEAESGEATFTALAECAPVGCVVFQLNGQPLWMNEAYLDLSGLKREDFGGDPHRWSSTVIPEDREYVEEQWEKLVQGVDVRPFEFRVRRPWHLPGSADESDRMEHSWVLANAFLKYDEAGNPQRILAWLTDISHQKWSQQLQAQRLEDVLETKRQSENFIDMTLSKLDSKLLVICPDLVQPVTLVERAIKMYEAELALAEIKLSLSIHQSC